VPARKPAKPLSARSVAYALTILTALGDPVRDDEERPRRARDR